ncbi:hypothetical protein GPN2_10678 [Streptomyces murinus]
MAKATYWIVAGAAVGCPHGPCSCRVEATVSRPRRHRQGVSTHDLHDRPRPQPGVAAARSDDLAPDAGVGLPGPALVLEVHRPVRPGLLGRGLRADDLRAGHQRHRLRTVRRQLVRPRGVVPRGDRAAGRGAQPGVSGERATLPARCGGDARARAPSRRRHRRLLARRPEPLRRDGCLLHRRRRVARLTGQRNTFSRTHRMTNAPHVREHAGEGRHHENYFFFPTQPGTRLTCAAEAKSDLPDEAAGSAPGRGEPVVRDASRGCASAVALREGSGSPHVAYSFYAMYPLPTTVVD